MIDAVDPRHLARIDAIEDRRVHPVPLQIGPAANDPLFAPLCKIIRND